MMICKRWLVRSRAEGREHDTTDQYQMQLGLKSFIR